MLNNKYALFCSKSDWFKYMFCSIENDDYFYISKNGISPLMDNKAGELFCSIIYSEKIKRFFRFPKFLKRLSYHLATKNVKLENGQKLVLIFSDTNRLSHDSDFLEFCRTRYKDVVLVRWFLDLMEISSLPEEEELFFCSRYYDRVITYDYGEAMKYGFSFVETPYSVDDTLPQQDVIYDVVFVGTAKIKRDAGVRYHKIIEVYKYLKEHNCKLKFYIVGVPEEDQIKAEDLVYNQYIPYRDVLLLDLQSKCILEVQQEKEVGTTLRIFEAIAYKKKLLIDNEEINKNPLFDSRFMSIFDNPCSIDLDFINNDSQTIDANIDSIHPTKFLQEIERLI